MDVSPKRIGIMGGSFNPIHKAHCSMAECFVSEVNCDVCYFIPSAVSPLKQVDFTVSSEHRLAMLALATKDNPLFKVSDVEILRGGISYTIDTVTWFQSQFPTSSLFLLIGADQALVFNRWKQWENILRSVQLCIIPRDEINDKEYISNNLTICSKKPLWLNCPIIRQSSTVIRENIKLNKPVSNFLSQEVAEYIYRNRLYTSPNES